MPVKFVAEVLKGLFGTSEQSTDDAETETSITVERESDEESPDEDQETAEESTDEPEDSEEPPESVEEITGIGPTYGERLSAVGIETVGDLMGADEGKVAEAAEVSESRAADWVAQAEDW